MADETRYGSQGFLIMDARYPHDPDRAFVLEFRETLPDGYGDELADRWGECVVVDAADTSRWTLIDAFGDVSDWSAVMEAYICAQAEKGLDVYGKPLEEPTE